MIRAFGFILMRNGEFQEQVNNRLRINLHEFIEELFNTYPQLIDGTFERNAKDIATKMTSKRRVLRAKRRDKQKKEVTLDA